MAASCATSAIAEASSSHNNPSSTTVTSNIPLFFLTELTSLDDLRFPTNSSKRIKYTCVSASARSLVLGTSTGTVYVFSRFAAKNRNRLAPVPVHVFTTKDGPVNKLSICPSEEVICVGSDSGRISMASLGPATQPAILHSVPGDARKPDKVTCMIWSKNGKQLYAGYSSGAVLIHRLNTRSVFRSSHSVLLNLDSEVVQLDISGDLLLISTTVASYVYNIVTAVSFQVGKKLRSGVMGACFIAGHEDSFIVAARPNGRLWEANEAGTVYRTHQFRQSGNIRRAPPVSFRSSFVVSDSDPQKTDVDVELHTIHNLSIDGTNYLLTLFGTRVMIVDVETSSVVLLTNFQNEVSDFSVCGADLFLLLRGDAGLRKYTVFSRAKVVEKLMLKGFHVQAAELMLYCYKEERWSPQLITQVSNNLGTLSKKKDIERLRILLQQLLENDGNLPTIRKQIESTDDEVRYSRLSSGVHRVHPIRPDTSGYEDDFTFRLPTPLRERSRSSPCVDNNGPIGGGNLSKRCSMPLTEKNESNSYPSEYDTAWQEKLKRAKKILEADGNDHLVESDSLRTLLQLEDSSQHDDVHFLPTVTLGNAARTLAELAQSVPMDLPQMITAEREIQPIISSRKGPNIVRVVRPNQAKVTARVAPVPRPPPIRCSPSSSPSPPRSQTSVSTQNFGKKISPNSVEANSNPVEDHQYSAKGIIDLNDEENNRDRIETEEWLSRRLEELSTSSDVAQVFPDNPKEEEKVVETEPLKNPFTCQRCSLHKSWCALSLLANVCKRVRISVRHYSTGGVPYSLDEWRDILERRCIIPIEQSLQLHLCARCETSINIANKAIADSWTYVALSKGKVNGERIREKLSSLNYDKMRNIFFPPDNQKNSSATNSSHSQAVLSNNGTSSHSNLVAEIVTNTESSGSADEKHIQLESNEYFFWLPSIQLKTLLTLCCIACGHADTMSIVKTSRIVNTVMSDEDWATLTSLKIREAAMKKNRIGHKIVNDLLSEMGLSLLMSVDAIPIPSSPISSRSSLYRRNSAPPIYSWIIDANGDCPICTQPLLLSTSGKQLPIVSHTCGHSYHVICVANRIGCIACRIRARKATSSSRGSLGVSRL